MKKVKRYNEEGYVTSDDSNAGMKEARDAIDADIAKTPSADYGDYMPESSSQTMVAAPKPKPKPKSVPKANYSNEGRSRSTSLNKPDYSNEGRRSVSGSTRNVLEEAKENVRRSNAARSSMAEASRPKMEVGRLPKKGPGLSNFKSGGSVSSRADGIAQRGKTKGRMC